MKYPAILKNTIGGQTVLAVSGKLFIHMSGKFEVEDSESYSFDSRYKNITREYLSNTWGVVESKEHAEFIIELAKANGLGFYEDDVSRMFFTFNKYSMLFFFSAEDDLYKSRCKQITIPLPPKDKDEKPSLSKLPIHFDCVCNKCGGKCCIGNCDEWSEVGGDKAMSNIKWKDGAVCFAGGEQYTNVFIPAAVMAKDFQLNEIRIGDCIPEAELNTEQKYNDAVEVFELFGFSFSKNATSSFYEFKNNVGGMVDHNLNFLSCCDDGLFHTDKTFCKRKLTYQQLITIGKLKRAMIDFEKFNRSDIPQNEKRNKSKQAYEILKSLDYEYDLDKQKWFKKHYI